MKSKEVKIMPVDWSKFEGGDNTQFVKFEPDKPKQVTVTNWRNDTKDYADGKGEQNLLVLDVLKEDGEECDPQKEISSSSKRFARAIKPHLQEADENGVKKLKLNVHRIGQGFETQYAIAKL